MNNIKENPAGAGLLMTRLATIGGAGQNVFAFRMPLRYLGCAETRWTYDKPIKTHLATAKTYITNLERFKQAIVTSVKSVRNYLKAYEHSLAAFQNRRGIMVPDHQKKRRASGSTITVPDTVIQSFEIYRNYRVTPALSGPCGNPAQGGRNA